MSKCHIVLLTGGFKELYLLTKGSTQATRRRLLDNLAALPSSSTSPPSSSPVQPTASGALSAFTMPRNILSPSPAPAPAPAPSSIASAPAVPPTKTRSPHGTDATPAKKKEDFKWIYVVALPVAALLVTVVVCVLLVTQKKTASAIKPWKSGISGQLQKAFVTGIHTNCLFLLLFFSVNNSHHRAFAFSYIILTSICYFGFQGVPKLSRAELVGACEDFSNIVTSYQHFSVYKGTLSDGVEIAVCSTTVTSAKDWSKRAEIQFRKKVLSYFFSNLSIDSAYMTWIVPSRINPTQFIFNYVLSKLHTVSLHLSYLKSPAIYILVHVFSLYWSIYCAPKTLNL